MWKNFSKYVFSTGKKEIAGSCVNMSRKMLDPTIVVFLKLGYMSKRITFSWLG
jgi:hypothetical protein